MQGPEQLPFGPFDPETAMRADAGRDVLVYSDTCVQGLLIQSESVGWVFVAALIVVVVCAMIESILSSSWEGLRGIRGRKEGCHTAL
jgi:hypothetical protein